MKALAVLAVVALTACGTMSPWGVRHKVDELRAAIDEEIPLGSAPAKVEAFLTEQGLSHSTSDPISGAPGSLYKERPDLVDDVRYTTGAIIHDAFVGPLWSESIQLTFYYNEDQEMIWSIVEIVADSL
jgi:hypothetical protein